MPASPSEVYRSLRARLHDDLGLEPSRELSRLHRLILRGDPALPAERDDALSSVPHRPEELPQDVPGFIGRTDEMTHLDQLSDGSSATTVWVVSGIPGVGKTALAVRWAHRVRGRLHAGTEAWAREAYGRVLLVAERPDRCPGDKHELCRLVVGDSRAVDVDEFWAVVESAGVGRDGRTGDDGEAVAAALVTRLAATSPERILEFQELFDQLHDALCRWDVWAAAYLIGGGCSDDSFIDFRAGVIALGREWYERVLASPDGLADHPVVRQAAAEEDDGALFAESVNYVASEAYEQVTSSDDDAFYEEMKARQHGAVGIDDACEPDMGEDFDFDDDDQMRRRLPRLAELFLNSIED